MSLKVPPPPSVIQRLQYWLSHLRSGLPSPVRLSLYVGTREPSGLYVPWPPRKRTSFIMESAPAIHLTATARGLIPPVSIPMPDIILVPPLGVSSMALGAPGPWKAVV